MTNTRAATLTLAQTRRHQLVFIHTPQCSVIMLCFLRLLFVQMVRLSGAIPDKAGPQKLLPGSINKITICRARLAQGDHLWAGI